MTGRRMAWLLTFAVYGALGLGLIAFLAPNTFVGADLAVYQRASHDLLEHGDPYHSSSSHPYQFQYRYPPLLAMLVVVLGWEPLWYALMSAATGWALLNFVRQTGPGGFLPVTVLGGAWGQALLNGNVQSVMMALLALVPLYRRAGAVALAVATMLKLHPVLGVVWYAGRRDWVALRWYALAVVALLLVQAPWLDDFASFYMTDELASPFGEAGFGLRTIHPALWVAGTVLMAVLAYRYANSRAGWLLNIGLQLVALPRVLLVNLALVLAAPLPPGASIRMPRPRLLVLGYTLLVTAAAVVFATAILSGPYRAVERSDYMTYHVAARIVLAGNGACLYEVECQAAAQRELIGDEPSFEHGPLPYNSPPWLAALITPLGRLPLTAGFAIFTLFGLSVLAASVWRLSWGRTEIRLIAILLLLTAWPTVMAVIRGQVTLVVVGLLSLSVAAARYRSGMALGLAALKPTLAPLWAAWQVLGGHWRAVGTATAVTLALVGFSALVVSPQAVVDYPNHLFGVMGADAVGVHPEEMINWRGAAERLGWGGWLVAAGTLGTLGLVVATWSFTQSRSLAAAAAFLATPLVIPHANQHEAILAGVGILLAVAAAGRFRPGLVTGAIAVHGFLWAGPLMDAESAAWLIFAAQVAWLAIVVVLARSDGRAVAR